MEQKLYSQSLVNQNLLFLDGLSRAGKFLLGKVISSFNSVESFQYEALIEHMPILYHLGKISKDDAVSYMKTSINMYIYHRAIGRGLNLRPGDGSSVLNAHDHAEYILRTTRPDGVNAIQEINSSPRWFPFLTHECMNFLDLFYDLSPETSVINIQRHPVDMIHSWYTRGWGERVGVDPLAFIPTVYINKDLGCPWFAVDFKDEYAKMKPADRVALSVVNLFDIDTKAIKKFENSKLLVLAYEDFFNNHDLIVDQISQFLNVKPIADIKKVFEREGCTKPFSLLSTSAKMSELKNLCSENVYANIARVSSAYEEKWGLIH